MSADNENFPFISVIDPCDIPFTVIVTPIKGSPALSVTTPVIFFIVGVWVISFLVSIIWFPSIL